MVAGTSVRCITRSESELDFAQVDLVSTRPELSRIAPPDHGSPSHLPPAAWGHSPRRVCRTGLLGGAHFVVNGFVVAKSVGQRYQLALEDRILLGQGT